MAVIRTLTLAISTMAVLIVNASAFSQEPINEWFLLESIEVPKGNPIRGETSSPRLFIELEKNGEHVGYSQVTKGWHANFKDRWTNSFEIDPKSPDKYTVKVWTDNWPPFFDQLLISIADLDPKSFNQDITEKTDGGVPGPAGRLVRIKFKKIPAP